MLSTLFSYLSPSIHADSEAKEPKSDEGKNEKSGDDVESKDDEEEGEKKEEGAEDAEEEEEEEEDEPEDVSHGVEHPSLYSLGPSINFSNNSALFNVIQTFNDSR